MRRLVADCSAAASFINLFDSATGPQPQPLHRDTGTGLLRQPCSGHRPQPLHRAHTCYSPLQLQANYLSRSSRAGCPSACAVFQELRRRPFCALSAVDNPHNNVRPTWSYCSQQAPSFNSEPPACEARLAATRTVSMPSVEGSAGHESPVSELLPQCSSLTPGAADAVSLSGSVSRLPMQHSFSHCRCSVWLDEGHHCCQLRLSTDGMILSRTADAWPAPIADGPSSSCAVAQICTAAAS